MPEDRAFGFFGISARWIVVGFAASFLIASMIWFSLKPATPIPLQDNESGGPMFPHVFHGAYAAHVPMPLPPAPPVNRGNDNNNNNSGPGNHTELDQDGQTALRNSFYRAVTKDSIDAVPEILARLTAGNRTRWATEAMSEARSVEMLMTLVEAGGTVEDIHLAEFAMRGLYKLVEYVLLTRRDSMSLAARNRALEYACMRRDNHRVIKVLLEWNADPKTGHGVCKFFANSHHDQRLKKMLHAAAATFF